MKYYYLFIFLFSCLTLTAAPKPSVKFIRNEGQWEASIRFRADIPGGYLLVKNTGVQYVFYDTEALAAIHAGSLDPKSARKSFGAIKAHAYEMTFEGANLSPKIESLSPTTATYNYFIGNDPTKWKSNVAAFDEIYLRDIYPDIDFKLYSFDQSLKYEYIVKPRADAAKIKMKYVGLDKISLDNEQLNYKTSVNVVKEFEPYSFQTTNNKTLDVKSKFRVNDNEVTFDFPENYNHAETLIIDPELVFSTYSGSKSDNWAQTATYDANGNLFAGGSVFGLDFPVTNGAFQVKGSPNTASSAESVSGYGVTDIVVMKFSTDGSTLLYSTFLGGNASDVPHSLVANSRGELVIFGTTSSNNFPVNNVSYQRNFAGGSLTGIYSSFSSADQDPNFVGIGFERGTDIFVTVLSVDGKSLVGSSYIGGSANDGFNDTRALSIKNYGDEFRGEVVVDADDNIYFASVTASINFPMVRPSQSVKGAGYDGVVCKLNRTCSQLLLSTYLGGNNFDAAYGIKVTDARKIYVCGQTFSANLAVKDGAFKGYGGGGDGFIAKFSSEGAIEQLTYVGTPEADINFFLETDKEENVYVFGLTLGDYPVSSDVYRNVRSGQFIHCFDKNLTKSIFSTTIGTGRGVGRIDIVPTAFLVNDCGNIYLSGWGGKVNASLSRNLNRNSTTTGLPITSDAYQTTTTGSNYYFMILEKGAKSLLYATFFGAIAPPTPEGEVGDHVDGGTCRFDKNGIIYHVACSCLPRSGQIVATFPTKNAYQPRHQSTNCNMAAFKFNIDVLKADFEIKNEASRTITEVCSPARVNFNNLSVGGKTYEWEFNGNVVSRLRDVSFNFINPGEYVVKLRIFNKITCRTTDSTTKRILVKGIVAKVNRDTLVCPDSPVQLLAEGGEKYTWSPATDLSSTSIFNPIAKPKSTTKYTVLVEKEGCSVSKDVTIKVEENKVDFLANGGKEVCAGQSVTLTAVGKATNITWSGQNIKDTVAAQIIVKPLQTSTYTVKGTYPDGCKPTRTVTVVVDNSFKPDFDFAISQDCDKPYQLIFTNKSPNARSYVWDFGNKDSLKVAVPENYRFQQGGTYAVTLKAYNSIGCVLTTTKNIDIPDNDGKVPNVITPNNDGKNDTFVTGFKNPTLDVYNRYGKLIYSSKNYQNDWGAGMAATTYYYVLTTPTGIDCKGWVTVVN